MPAKNDDLHGNVPEEAPVVLLMIDVINDLEFEGGERLLESALAMAPRLKALAGRAREAGVPVIYANDNFGRWRSDLHRQVRHCLEDGVRGKPVVELLRPEEDDYFVLKPKHSAFFSTTLDTLLAYLGARVLILTGTDTASCVLFTASDAHMRDFIVVVPPDCTASRSDELQRRSLRLMTEVVDVRLIPSEEIDFAALAREAGGGVG